MAFSKSHVAQFPGREIPVLEWKDGEDKPPLFLLAGDGSGSDWAGLAERLASDFRVLALETHQRDNLMEGIWASGEPAIVIAQGQAGEAAIRLATYAPGSVRALILADYSLPAGAARPVLKPVSPCLVFSGRQSETASHRQSVELHEAIPGSQLIEPEDCGPWPEASFSDSLSQAFDWFTSRIELTVMEFQTAEGAISE